MGGLSCNSLPLRVGLEVEIKGDPCSILGVWGSEARLLLAEESRSSITMGSCLDEVDLVVLCDAIMKDFLVGVEEGFGFGCLDRVFVPKALALTAKRLRTWGRSKRPASVLKRFLLTPSSVSCCLIHNS